MLEPDVLDFGGAVIGKAHRALRRNIMPLVFLVGQRGVIQIDTGYARRRQGLIISRSGKLAFCSCWKVINFPAREIYIIISASSIAVLLWGATDWTRMAMLTPAPSERGNAGRQVQQ